MNSITRDTQSLHIHLDPVGGVAGDMFVAAMMDLFPAAEDTCWQDLRDSGVMQYVNVALQPGISKGMAVKRLHVTLKDNPARRTGQYGDLRCWLDESALEESVRQHAQSILHLLAEAEANVHGVDIEQVHFHEVADWDSIVDVVAAASMIERSRVQRWSCAALPLGSGLVRTEHGMLPVPAPATTWLLKDLSVWDDGEPGERVTPTGAAIVRHVLDSNGRLAREVQAPTGILVSMGCGAGQRELQQRPNILRCLLIDTVDTGFRSDTTTSVVPSPSYPSSASIPGAVLDLVPGPGQRIDEVMQLSFDIDDMTPEELSVSLEHLRREKGVLDASFQLGMGKKGRAFFAITVLCRPVDEATVSERCLEETTTLGMRVQKLHRRTLHRESHTVETGQYTAGVKSVARPSGVSTAKVESDDLATTSGLQARRLLAQSLRKPFES